MKYSLVVPMCLGLVSTTLADPPSLKTLYPAGVQRGTTATLTANGSFKSWPVDVWCNHSKVKIVPTKKRGQLSVSVAKDALPGVCWVRLFNAEGASELRPFVIGTLPDALEKEPNNEPSKPQSLTENVVVNGRLQSAGDVDVFAIELKKDQTLVASMRSRRTFNSPMDGVLQILSGDGFVLAQNDDYHDMDPQIVFRTPKDGRYLVRTFSFPAKPNSSVRFAGGSDYIYRLTLTTGPFFDHAYPLAVRKGEPATVDVFGWNLPAGDISYPLHALPNSNIAVAFHPLFANAVRVRLESHLTTVEQRQKGPQILDFPSTVSGRLSVDGEADEYQFALKKGQRFQIDIDAATLGAPLDPVLTLTDEGGKVVKQAQTRTIGTDPAITLTASKDATYRISVRDLHSRGGMRFVYRLRIAAPTPDFELKIAKDRFDVAVGKTLEIPVTITRKNGLRESIEIVAEGLPVGVSANPVVAEVKAKSVKLRIVAGKKLSRSAFQIIGRATDIRRNAEAAVADLDTKTPYFFLTVKAK